MQSREDHSSFNLHHQNVVDIELANVPEGTPTPTPNALPIPECRICLESEHQPDNELVAPCSCTGSIRYIHANCFKEWIKKKAEDPKVRQQILGDGIKC